jgi:hypothetical protein
MLNVENYSVVSANIAVAMFTLKRATTVFVEMKAITVFVEMLDNFQHSTECGLDSSG